MPLKPMSSEQRWMPARASGSEKWPKRANVPPTATDRAAFVAEGEARMGAIDVLVANAGVMPLGPFVDERDEVSRLTLDVNVWGLVVGLRAVLPGMLARGHGHVVNVASMAGLIPIPGMVTYNASKFAVLGASLTARREYAGTGVAVSAILPSAVRTELSSGARLGRGMPTVDAQDVAAAQALLGRLMAARPAADWAPLLQAAGVPAAVVRTPAARQRLGFHTYTGGHMFYLRKDSRAELARDVRSFFETAP